MLRRYFITAGSVLYRSGLNVREALGPGRCWGAGDVLSAKKGKSALCAVAASFVHVQ